MHTIPSTNATRYIETVSNTSLTYSHIPPHFLVFSTVEVDFFFSFVPVIPLEAFTFEPSTFPLALIATLDTFGFFVVEVCGCCSDLIARFAEKASLPAKKAILSCALAFDLRNGWILGAGVFTFLLVLDAVLVVGAILAVFDLTGVEEVDWDDIGDVVI
jgi:hypothetical protein